VAREVEQALPAARDGDPQALARLCTAYYPRVLRYMRYRVGATEAQDLTNEVFLRVVRGIRKQRGSFEAWLYTIARHVVIDHKRRHKAQPEVSGQMTETASSLVGGGEKDILARRLDLEEALTRLTDAQREFLTLKFIQGLSNADITTLMNKQPGALRVLQFRALAALRKILTEGVKGNEQRTADG